MKQKCLCFDADTISSISSVDEGSYGFWQVFDRCDLEINDFVSNKYTSDISDLDYIWIYGYDFNDNRRSQEIENFVSFINENVKSCKNIVFDLQGEGSFTETYLQYFDKFRKQLDLNNYTPKILWNINKPVTYKDYSIFYAKYYEMVYWYKANNITNLNFRNEVNRKYFLSFLNGKLRKHREIMLELVLANTDNFGNCLISNLDKSSKLPYIDVGGWEESKSRYASAESLIRDSYINLVSESNYTNTDGIFITEKSIKPFIYQQIPIFLSAAGTVKHLRKYGFDVFDDIVNHAYDDESDITIRCKMILQQLLALKQIDLKHYFESNETRFLHNFNLYQRMISEIDNIDMALKNWILT